MYLKQSESSQLDAEILLLVKNEEPITGYGIVKSLAAAPTTVRRRLRKLVEKGELDCHEDGKAKTYTIPSPETGKAKLEAFLNRPKPPRGRPPMGRLPSENAYLKKAEQRRD